jgi:peptidoglycan/xylan/chitin deacetylase (PgdA/CDA1 family)
MRRRVRAQLVPLAISFGLGPLLLASGPPAYRAGPSAHGDAPGGQGPRAALSPLVDRYRLAGCRDRGALAFRHGPHRREVAIGFDDGPSPQTPAFVEMLERNRARATFFVVGSQLSARYTAVLDRELRDGDAIGDHTEAHAPMSKLSAVAQRAQVLEDATAIELRGARFPRLFRPPYGMWNAATLALLHRYRMLMVMWTVDTNDYRRPGVRAIVRAALAGARPGAIILLHDAGGDRAQTVRALPKIIAALRRRHFRFVTVPRLLLDNPPPRVQNIASVIGTGG